MHLKSFSTYGFKSFADKTELTFTEGITAIVGPNGSGKSNISDAIRWVLGEQSAKYLRGSKMEDVIFSGSSKRRALGVAEVTLNFDNSDHSLPLDFEEVSLTRRLFRSGDSDYAINKKSCRLKDILDLMADTGLGKGSMSIIGQNKIDEILNSRPEERRAIFEEAAGIAKYRLRKKDATRRLEATASNLTRINDIKSEVDKQVGPLYLAAEKTKQYNSLNAELKRYHMTNLYHKLNALEQAKEELKAKKDELSLAYAEQAGRLGAKEAELTKLQKALDELLDRFNQLQEDLKDKETTLARLQGEKGVLEERIAQSERSSNRLEERNIKLNEQADGLEKQQQGLAKEFDVLENTRLNHEQQVKQLEAQKEEQAQNLIALQNKSADEQSAFFTSMQELLKLRNELHTLEQQQEQRMRQRDALKVNIEECEELVNGLEKQFQDLLEKISQKENAIAITRKQYTQLAQETTELEATVRKLQQEQQQCERKLTATETRAQSLRKLQEAYEGFGLGIKMVLKSQESWREDIVGVVAELIKVPSQYVAALETALGEGAQNIVTKNAGVAKQAIAYLKQQNAGRATFLPLDTVQARIPNAEEQRLTKLPGVCGFASELITMEPEAEKAVRFLLGRVLVAENIDAALHAAKAGRYRLRVVTLDGDVVNAGGSMTGGSRRHREGYLSREEEIAKVLQAMEGLKKEMLSWQEQVEVEEAKLKKLRQKLQETENQGQQEKLKLSELQLRQKQVTQDKAREAESLNLYLDRRSLVTNEYMANRDKVKELRTNLQAKEQADADAKALLADMQRDLARMNTQLTATTNMLQDAKVQLETAAAKTQLMNESMQNLDQETLRVREEIRSNQEEQERLSQVITTSKASIAALGEQSEALQL
ncbi:MAG: chromosome segregation protein SMC, partial [Phascolarctobacterium sp.]|nr:chromosome segregation protein SMC [Phascolarctobacterium sp.]